MMVLGTLAAEVTARAVVRAVRAAESVRAGKLYLPAVRDIS
jgi:L-aminopeptidase/D-esterase-like protein